MSWNIALNSLSTACSNNLLLQKAKVREKKPASGTAEAHEEETSDYLTHCNMSRIGSASHYPALTARVVFHYVYRSFHKVCSEFKPQADFLSSKKSEK